MSEYKKRKYDYESEYENDQLSKYQEEDFKKELKQISLMFSNI